MENDILEKIRNICEKNVKEGDEYLKENDVDYFGDGCCDEDGIPNSFGNADDVLSDGLTTGNIEGRYNLANEILQIFKEKGLL